MAANEPKPVEQSPTSSPSKAERDATVDAVNHLIQGKRHLLVQDIPSAVASLQEACQLLAACYGEVANECGEAYFYYGKALLEMAREENSILGNAIGEERDTDDDVDDEDEDEDEDDEEEADNDEKENSDENKTSSDGVDDKNNKTEKKENEETTQPVQSDVEGKPGPSSVVPDSSKKEEEEDVTNLQLAWEMLELSKLIFSRQSEGNREKLLKLAEVHLYLGEVSLESENYGQAIEEFNRCLSIQRELLQPEDRLLAETHYQLGLACSFNNMFDESVENFKEACRIIEDKISVLSITAAGKEMEKEPDIMSSGDPVAKAKREIEELKEILPEIREKITDTEESKKNAIESMRAAALQTSSLIAESINAPQTSTSAPDNSVASSSSEMTSSSTEMMSSSSSSSTSKPISNIGHLVKRKRKPESDCDSEQNQKRTCPSPTEQQKKQQPSSSDVSSSTESTVSSATARNVEESMEATSSTASTINYQVKRTEVVVSEDVDCVVTSATKCNSERSLEDVKIADGGHCDSVYNGDSRDTNAISSHPIPDLPQLNEIAVEATNV